MAPKKGWSFPSSAGFRASAGQQTVPGYQRRPAKFAEGGAVKGDPNGGALQKVPSTQINDAHGVTGRKVVPGYKAGGKVKEAVHKHERSMHPDKALTPLKRGGVYSRKPLIGG